MANLINQMPLPQSLSVADQVEMIWAMGYASLLSNKYQLIVPTTMAQAVGVQGINELKSRLSRCLQGANIIAYNDDVNQTIRIGRLTEYKENEMAQTFTDSPYSSADSPASTASSAGSPPDTQDLSAGQRLKVPRPPNAFILYRKHFHPILKDQNPHLHNNEISVILGKKWNNEAEDVKSEYRIRADKIKKKHAIDNPGYQYAPRKPSEKKRRMTARKLAQLKASDTENSMPNASTDSPTPSATELIGVTVPSAQETAVTMVNDELEVAVQMPVAPVTLANQLIQQQQQLHPDTAVRFDDTLPQTCNITTDLSTQTTNEQDFLNSLIDWDGIRADSDIVFGTTFEESQELAGVESGDSQIDFLGMTDAEFAAELQRITTLL